MSTARRTRKSSSSGSDISNPSAGSEPLSGVPKSENPSKKRSGETDTPVTSTRSRRRHAPASASEAPPEPSSPKRTRPKRKASEMEQSTAENAEKAALSSSSSAIPIPSSTAAAASSRSKRTKTVDDEEDIVENEEHSEEDDDDKGEGLLFGDDDQMQSDEGSQAAKPQDGEDGKPKDEENERKKLDQLMQKFGSPQDFNPMMHMNSTQWDNILVMLNDDDPSLQLSALMDLHSTLSISNEDTMGSFKFDQFIPALLKFLQNSLIESEMYETLAIQCFFYLVDSYPPSGSFLIRHGVVPVLCEKLLNIGGSIDVPEQAIKLIALMSEHAASGLHVLRSGGLAGLLAYLDFFGMDVQMKALAAASNIVRHVPKESYQSVIDAMPHLLNVLQSHHDARIVEKACLAVSRIVENLHVDTAKLRELDPNSISSALIRHMSISSSGATPETASTANLAVRTLATLCRSCPDLVEALLVQNVPEILRALLNLEQEYAKTKAAQASKMFSAQHVYDIMALISHLLPPLPSEVSSLLRSPQGSQPQPGGASALLRAFGARLGLEEPVAEKTPASPVPASEQSPSETDPRLVLFTEQPQLLAHLAGSILPSLLRVFGSMVNIAVRYKCLTAIAKIIHHAPPALLSESLKDLTISAFIASLLSSKDPNIVCAALHMAETLIQKLPTIFSEYFMREGVVHEVDKLIRGMQVPESPAQSVDNETIVGSPMVVAFSPASPDAASADEVLSTSAPGAAVPGSAPSTPAKTSHAQQMREKAHLMAKSFKEKYFSGSSAESSSSEALVQLKELSEQLNKVSGPTQSQVLEDICKLLFKGISTFEVLQSGMAEALVEFIRRGGISAARAICSVLARPVSDDVNGALVLVRELQKALDKVEKLNVAVNPAGGSGSSGLKYLTYPFKVQLKKAEGETNLKNYGDAVIMIEPLATMSAVKDFLRRRLVLSMSQEQARTETSAEASAEPPASNPTEPAATSDSVVIDEAPVSANESKGENVGEGEEEIDAVGDDVEDEAADLDQMAQDSADDMDASMDRSVHDIEVSEDHSSRGDLQEPDAPAQETQASKPSSAEIDFEIQFTLSGQEPDDSNTVFQIFHEYALRKHNQNQQPSEASDAASFSLDQPAVPLTRLWEDVYIVEYQRRPQTLSKSAEVASSLQKSEFASSASAAVTTPASVGLTSLLRAISDANEYSEFHGSLLRAVGRDAQTATILQLLRLLHEISIHAASLSSRPTLTSLIPVREFSNGKLTSKLMRQLQDALMVCAGSLPLWCTFLTTSTSLHFIFPFELRQLLFRATSLGISRALAALQDQLHDATDIRIGRIPRQKVRISRERILESAIKVSQLVKGNRGILEVEYFNEVGTGLGPTLEFYTLVSKEVQRRDLNIWLDSGNSGNWVDSPAGLFPRPTNPAAISEETIKYFEFIGSFVAKAMFDNRLLDIPFSPAFLKKILGLPLDLADLQPLLPDVTKSLLEFMDLINQMHENPQQPVLYKKAKLEDLELYFVYPSDQSWELVAGGADHGLTQANLPEYVQLVTKAVMEEGIQKQFDAFKRGFDSIFPIRSIAFFAVEELDSLLCGSMQDHQPWDRQTILENSKFDHGYSASSRAVGYLVEVLTELTPEQRRKFLKFATGSTRLPPRGFKDMNPKLTFVRKEVDPSSSPDDYMPSVNTCFGYLKLPEYSSKEVLKKRLIFAIEHGQDAFSFN
eukprot:TRINITY_DN10518_c0_g1_i1.p1 TRINITY_DN10518_c0_g1~~TRINITY_DN10518_c0_g1_i1.p1  ORF type:complete len:1704 (-),score=351.99 TRINITY_DN10518_c0_g1_i1:7-5118(-)